MNSRDNGLSAEFTRAGVVFHQQAYNWGLSLSGYGYGDNLRATSTVTPNASANRVEYRRGALTEWYVNGPLGVEQGFTLQHAPETTSGEPLTLAFALSGELTPSVEAGGSGLTLAKDGMVTLRYSGLTAYDAGGRELRSWLQITDGQLRVRVEDAGAQYPLTIDPYVQAVKLTTQTPCASGGTCDDGKAYGYFGASVAMSDDGSTVVVGASGEAYVFLRPPVAQGGWNSTTPIYYAAKLSPSDAGDSTTYFGRSVAMTPDATTIVVGDPEFYYPGKVYVFLKPPSGWSSSTPLLQTAKLTSWWRATDNQLGYSVAISADGKIIAGGAPTMTGTGTYQGGAYVYMKPTNGWVNSTENSVLFLVDGRSYEYLGASVSMSADGNTIVAGAPYTGGTSGIGSAWVFSAIGEQWGTIYRDAKLIPSDNNYANFGRAVSISADGKTVAVSASGCPRLIECGYVSPNDRTGVYVYGKVATSWYSATPRTENAKLTSTGAGTYQFVGAGLSLSADGSIIAASAPTYDFSGIAPSVKVFVRPATGWTSATETTTVTTVESGYSISMNNDGSAIVIGTPWTTVGSNVRQGTTYVFTGSPNTPIASVSPSAITFSSQPVGTTSNYRTVTVTNTGTAPLRISGVAVTGQFTSTQNCAVSSPIAPSSSCSENVTFVPSTVGSKTGTLTFTDDSGGLSGTTQQVQLQGDAVKATTSTVITGVTSSPALVGKPVTIAYTVAPQAANTLTPSGMVTVQASTGENCTGSAPAGSCAITFQTAVDRTVTATFSGDANFITSASSPVLVHIVDFALSVSPSSQTATGKKATYTVTVMPVNGFNGTVSLSCAGGPANTTCAMSPTSVSLSGAAITAKANITVPNIAATGTYAVSFTGQSGGVTRSTTATLVIR